MHVPIHYHCEKTDVVDDEKPFAQTYPNDMDLLGTSAFSVGDSVRVMFRGAKNTRPLIVGFAGDPKNCFGYLIMTIGNYCTVWDLSLEMISDKIPLNSNPMEMANFPVFLDNISNWKNSREEVIFDSLFSSEQQSGLISFPPIITSDSGYLYNNSHECTGPLAGGEWYEDYGKYSTVQRINTQSNIFGSSNLWQIDRYSYNNVIIDGCPGVIDPVYSWKSWIELAEYKYRTWGFILTALNGSEDTLEFKVTEVYSYSSDTYLKTIWFGDCAESTGTEEISQVQTPTFQYFTESSRSRIGSRTRSGCDGEYSPAPPSISEININIESAAHFSEDYGAVVQLFVRKDDDGNYYGYGQANIGIDHTLAPTSLDEQSDLSSALQSLADIADSNLIVANYYI